MFIIWIRELNRKRKSVIGINKFKNILIKLSWWDGAEWSQSFWSGYSNETRTESLLQTWISRSINEALGSDLYIIAFHKNLKLSLFNETEKNVRNFITGNITGKKQPEIAMEIRFIFRFIVLGSQNTYKTLKKTALGY